LRAPDLGIFAEIADQNHLVHATGHDALLLLARLLVARIVRGSLIRGSLILSLGPRRRFRRRHHAFPQQDGSPSAPAGMFSFCSNTNSPHMQRFR
jgi:hypothetical protein